MQRHLTNKRVVSGVLFWAPSNQDAAQDGAELRYHRPSPIHPLKSNLRNNRTRRGLDEVDNVSDEDPKYCEFSINHLRTFPHIPEQIRSESPTKPQSQTQLCLPILSVSIDISVDGMVACTDLTQKFINPSDIFVPEARHSFPLYKGAVITSFDCTIGDRRHLVGWVKPTQLAKDEFNSAKTSRKRQAAALLEEATPEMFETTLGNIPPHTIVTVKLKYVHELEVVVMKDKKAEGLAIIIPSSIAPCYEGSISRTSHHDPKLSREALVIDIRVVDNGIIDVENCHIESGHDAHYQGTRPMPRPVAIGSLAEVTKLSVRAPEMPPMQSVWHYKSASPVLKKDFVLSIQMRPEYPLRSRAVVEPADSRGLAAMMVSLRPTDVFGSAVRPQAFMGELLFILDRSSSMGVAEYTNSTIKIDTMRGAMELALSGLPDTCAFNIISFGSQVRGMWLQSRSASDSKNIAHARAYLSHIEADMLGTEVLQALKAAASIRSQSRDSTQIVLVTDGEVYEPQEPILKFVWEKRQELGDKIRFFTLGIGDHVSHHMMESIAELGGGYCDVIDIAKRPYWEGRLNRMLRSAMEPNNWSCEIALGPGYHIHNFATTRFALSEGPSQQASVPYVQAPYPIPPLQPYRYKSLFFLLNLRGKSIPSSVAIITTTPGAKKREYRLDVESNSFNMRTIHHLAAKAVLVGLEKEVEKNVAREGNIDTARANAEELGMEYAISSKWTSFVAVEGGAEEQEQTVKIDTYSAPVLELTEDELLRLETDSTSSLSDNLGELDEPLQCSIDHAIAGASNETLGTLSKPPRQSSTTPILDLTPRPMAPPYHMEPQQSPAAGIRLPAISDTDSVTSSKRDSTPEEENASISWRSVVQCQQQDGLFLLDEILTTSLRLHFCAAAPVRLDEQLRKLDCSHVLADGAVAMMMDTLMMMAYFETHLATERESWDLFMSKAERKVLLLLGYVEDEDEMLAPLREMLMGSIIHVHFNEAVYSASVERQSGDKRGGRDATVKTCPICDVDFDAGAWPECCSTSFVCCNDGCYDGRPGGRSVLDNWDLLWEHQVKSGHLCCPEMPAT